MPSLPTVSATMPPPSGRPPDCNLAPRDVEAPQQELVDYHQAFHPRFARAEQRRWALAYLQGQLLELERTSIEPMALALPEGEVRVWPQRPATAVPPARRHGRPLRRERLGAGATPALRVEQLAATVPPEAWVRRTWDVAASDAAPPPAGCGDRARPGARHPTAQRQGLLRASAAPLRR